MVITALMYMAAVAGAQSEVEWYRKGVDAFDTGNYEKAITYSTKAIELERFIPGHTTIGNLHMNI